jgi:hypothetical protein
MLIAESALLCLALFAGMLVLLEAGFRFGLRYQTRSRARHLLHGSVFAAAVSLTVYTILDLDNPSAGLIRLDAADRVLEELRDSI